MSELQEHRFGLYDERPAIYSPTGVPIAEADTEEGARLAVKTLVADAIDAGSETPTLASIWDADARTWVLWVWPCSRCQMTTSGPGLCGDCRRDADLGENRISRRDDEVEGEYDRRIAERDVWEPRYIP